jgi:hypothetical protein
MRPLDQFSVGDKGQGKALCHSPIVIVFGMARTFPSTISPTKVSAQVLRHQLRTKVRSMACFYFAIPIHATGFSQWLMTNFF